MKKGIVKIEFNKEQYTLLMRLMNMGSFVYGLTGDVDESETGEKMKRIGKRAEVLEDYMLQHAESLDFKGFESYEGERSFSESFDNESMEHLDAFEEFVTFDSLATELGQRDFFNAYSEKELDALVEKHGQYLGVPMHPFLQKYHDEFTENGYDRLRIVEDSKEHNVTKE